MTRIEKRVPRPLVLLLVGFIFAVLAAPIDAQAKILVDATLGEVKPEEKVTVTQPRPVQLLFEFQTDGVTNAKATKYARPIVTKELQATGTVAGISDVPADETATLSIVVNNITEKGAASKGFKVGLTFGLAGAVVQDKYEIQFRYARAPGQEPIARSIQHRIYAKVGSKQDPENAMPVKNVEAAVQLMLHQAIAHGMNQIVGDPAFSAVAAGPAPAAIPVPASATTP